MTRDYENFDSAIYDDDDRAYDLAKERGSEAWCPEPPPPRAPRFVERTLPLCPVCSGLARRDILAMTSEGQRFGPWRCDLHGEVTPRFEVMQVPTGDEEEDE